MEGLKKLRRCRSSDSAPERLNIGGDVWVRRRAWRALAPATTARLPSTYESAKTALAECHRIDECKDWADRAEALASYARQAKDDELRRMADRIQARAIHRAGELLKEIPPAPGVRTDLE